jgi:hypothetical protein
MKKVYVFFAIMLSMSFLISCGGSGDKKTFDKNTDVVGEADSISPHGGTASDNYVKATLNGREVEFTFMNNMITAEKVFNMPESVDGKYTSFSFELGSDSQLREKIGMQIINYPMKKENAPFVFPKGKQEGKLIKLELGIQKSSVFINYNNEDNFACSLTAISDDLIEGTFTGEVRNPMGRTIRVENGVFRIKVKRTEMKIQ